MPSRGSMAFPSQVRQRLGIGDLTKNLTNAVDICRINFATARTPWDGLAVNYAWAIYDAVMVKKWNFNY